MTTIVVIHLAAAIAAVMLGIAILMARRGTPRHRWMGRTWAVTMAVTALSSFGIRELNPGHLSWLHALAVWVLVSLVLAIVAIRRGNVASHRRSMVGLYVGLIVAGVAAVALPGRVLNETLAHWAHGEVSVAMRQGTAGGEGTR
ncbi:DUF2306 domain-containing protein [Pandoraea pneumonica]|uniref:DUF2306 domain-containing protein n=1 Tax=Pandoraea pneumonica TaxID=2508299 RepID=UPI003CEDCD45